MHAHIINISQRKRNGVKNSERIGVCCVLFIYLFIYFLPGKFLFCRTNANHMTVKSSWVRFFTILLLTWGRRRKNYQQRERRERDREKKKRKKERRRKKKKKKRRWGGQEKALKNCHPPPAKQMITTSRPCRQRDRTSVYHRLSSTNWRSFFS